MPEWARKPVQAAVDKGILKGDKENGWGLTYEDLKSSLLGCIEQVYFKLLLC